MNNLNLREFGTQNKFLNLPDTSYWLSREELILSYLFQRNAAVPQVLKKDLVNKSLTLRHVGYSADQLLSQSHSPKKSDLAALEILEQTINALLNIHSLGVQHLDVALRNIATPDFDSVSVRLLDFTHALSAHNHLQKPLPLIPVRGLHHPRLIDALIHDWNDYFTKLGKACPKLDESLNISNDEFTNYWTNSTHVQLLCDDMGILSHSIGNLTLEMTSSVITNDYITNSLSEEAHQLRSLDKNLGLEAISSLQYRVKSLLSDAANPSSFISNTTPIPTISHRKVEAHSLLHTAGADTLSTINIEQPPQSKPQLFKSRFFGLLAWSAVLSNIFLIDHGVTSNFYKLSDFALYTCIATLLFSPTLVAISLIARPRLGRIFRGLALILVLAAQITVLIDCVPLSIGNLLVWLTTPFLFVFSCLTL